MENVCRATDYRCDILHATATAVLTLKLFREYKYLTSCLISSISWSVIIKCVRAWWCRGVSGSLDRGTRELTVPNGPRWYSRCNMCPDFFPGCCSGGHRCSHKASILMCVCIRGRPEPGLHMWECFTDHCWKQRHTTDTLCPTCAAIRRYVHPVSRRPTMRPRSNGKLFNRSTYSSAGHGCTLK